MLSSSSVITLPDGFSCDLRKNSIKQLGKTGYTFTVPVAGRGSETFEWRHMGLFSVIKGGESGWKLFRKGDETRPLVNFKDCSVLSSSSDGSELGEFEFVGEGATGELGQIWTTVAVIAFLKAQQKMMEKEIIKAVTGGI